MPQRNQVFYRDLDEIAITYAQACDPLRAEGAEHRGDLHGVSRDAGEERRVRRHQDDVSRARLDHLGVRGLAALRPLNMAQVDEPEAVALCLESLPELLDAHGDRRVVGWKRQSRKHEHLMMTGGPMGPGHARRHLETALATATDQDLALNQEGDGLLDRREADLMLDG